MGSLTNGTVVVVEATEDVAVASGGVEVAPVGTVGCEVSSPEVEVTLSVVEEHATTTVAPNTLKMLRLTRDTTPQESVWFKRL